MGTRIASTFWLPADPHRCEGSVGGGARAYLQAYLLLLTGSLHDFAILKNCFRYATRCAVTRKYALVLTVSDGREWRANSNFVNPTAHWVQGASIAALAVCRVRSCVQGRGLCINQVTPKSTGRVRSSSVTVEHTVEPGPIGHRRVLELPTIA